MGRGKAFLYATAVGALALDQITKAMARSVLTPDRPVRVIPGLFDLQLTFNSGAAFGILPKWAPLFIIIALVTIFGIVKLKGARGGSRSLAIGFGLLLGGAAGNLIDRLFAPSKEVTDFLSWHISIGGDVRAWPTFNVADVAIVAGVILVVFSVFIFEKYRADEN